MKDEKFSISKRKQTLRQRLMTRKVKLLSQRGGWFSGVTKNSPKESRNLYIENTNSGLDKNKYVKLKSMIKSHIGNTSELKCTQMT